ncbi:hypothetical protein QBC35DRAFT_190158 [Podospora australis]|uniref:Heterokaryon incompatibility domain-containing protein n=1 Tax=Podospora australis TaxID=1536484 RepID=A0AAN6WWJ5_9PEZI|nr:hypothetical protein QBC35DRAFT_190158 [Podospora australis]
MMTDTTTSANSLPILHHRKKYEYIPLTDQPRHLEVFSIRLIHLLPSTDRASPLRCQLVEISIPDYIALTKSHLSLPSPRPEHDYQALSYTWGDPVFPETLEVVSHTPSTDSIRDASTVRTGLDSGPVALGVIEITQNLHSALQCLRRDDETLLLWVDAVCINQADVLERNISDFLDENKGAVINSFLERPWFRRRWIIQEVVLARSVFVHCGAWCIPWRIFESAMIQLSGHMGAFNPDHRTMIHAIILMRTNMGVKRQLPMETLLEYSSFLCADPRDRLYALYGVMQRWFPGGESNRTRNQTGTINYALSTEDVFTNFAIMMIELDMPLENSLKKGAITRYKAVTHVLQLATAFGHQDKSDKNQLGGKLPSWVVDWTGTLRFKPLNHSPTRRDASLGVPVERVIAMPSKDGMRYLIVVGIPFDAIIATVPLDIAALLINDEMYEAKRELSHFLGRIAECSAKVCFPCGKDGNTYTPAKQHLVMAVAISIVASWQHTPAGSYFGRNPRSLNNFLEQLERCQYYLPDMLQSYPAYVELVKITMRGRCLFLTGKGFMGIAAAGAEPGDIVTVLSDINNPFIIRPSMKPTEERIINKMAGGNALGLFGSCWDGSPVQEKAESIHLDLENPSSSTSRFKLISDAYVHGLMHGEAWQLMSNEHLNGVKVFPI